MVTIPALLLVAGVGAAAYNERLERFQSRAVRWGLIATIGFLAIAFVIVFIAAQPEWEWAD